MEKGLRYIGVFKNSNRDFPIGLLSDQKVANRGEHIAIKTTTDDKKTIAAVICVDWGRKYFISTYGTATAGTSSYRERWRSIARRLQLVKSEIDIVKVCENYCRTFAQVYRRNRCCQDDLNLERKIEVKEWLMRVKTTLLTICCVDA